MFRTLLSLVVAMTATSALLGFIDPSKPVDVEPPSFASVLPVARELVAGNVDLRRDHWRGVEVLAGPTASKFLTATAAEPDLHFVIDVDGRLHRTAEWSRQDPRSLRPRPIRIQVARRGEHEPMSRSQWHGVRALVAAIHEAVAAEQSVVEVRFEAEWATIYGLEADAVLEMAPLAPSAG